MDTTDIDMGPLTPFKIVHEEEDYNRDHVVSGFDKVTLTTGSVFRVCITGMMYGTRTPGVALSRTQSKLVDMDGCVVESEIEITIPRMGFASLECSKVGSVHADCVGRPEVILRCEELDNLTLQYCKFKEIHSTLAAVHLASVTCESATISTQSNNVNLMKCDITGSVVITSVSGNINQLHCSIGESLKIETITGNVSVLNHDNVAPLYVFSTSGTVRLYGKINGVFQINTVFGEVKLCDLSGKGGVVKTMSGNVYFSQKDEVDSVSVSTESGNLSGWGKTMPTFSTVTGNSDLFTPWSKI